MDISIVIPTWNNCRRLAQTLSALCGCEVPPAVDWELVVVNNQCTDDTDAVVANFSSRLPIVYVKEPRLGLSRAKNAGVAAARGRLIIFTDDDVTPCREWISAYWEAFLERPRGYYFGGPLESEFEVETPDVELLRISPPSVRGLDHGTVARVLEKGGLVAANWACPRDVLIQSGGFDENLGLNAPLGVGEETDLMQRLRGMGLLPWYVPAARVKHFVPASKLSLKHIANRNEAAAYYSVVRFGMQRPPGRWWVGTLLWEYARLARRFVRWCVARMAGRPGYQEYVSFRRQVGKVKALRDRRRGISLPASGCGDRR